MAMAFMASCRSHRNYIYQSYSRPTPNIGKGVNDVNGIVLHHTASPSLKSAISTLTTPANQVSCHVIIDRDGTRYVLAKPSAITWHAGYSSLHGREKANSFTVGIEFQGNTLEKPLTKEQIRSAITYLIPIIEEYHIPVDNIVTHQMVRSEWLKNHPGSKVPTKVDITPKQYKRVMKALDDSLKHRRKRSVRRK